MSRARRAKQSPRPGGPRRDDRRRAHREDVRDEVTAVARDPHRTDRLLRLLPLLAAVLVSAPLLWLSLAFSLHVAPIAVLLLQLGGDAWALLGVGLMTAGGFLCLVGALVCLFVGWRRDTWRWRWTWAGATVLAAGAMPLLGVVTGTFWG